MKSLVIVESPAKAKTIEKYLGKKFMVKASMGHVVDLPKSQFGVDLKDGFKPKYITIRGKGKIIKELKDLVKKADSVFLATDPDREGEAISWHLANTLELGQKPFKRIEFHEITKKAIENSIKNPRDIDMDLVNAQQARRILDRIVGYELSPLLWKKVRRGLSAGRVQSVAVRLICERENEIREFVSEEFWTITGQFLSEKKESFQAKLAAQSGKKIEIKDESAAKKIEADLRQSRFSVTDVKKKERLRYPAPPFTTSSLQQEAARKLGYTAKKTMIIAQQLYEGLELEEGNDGLITYMRTDSVRVAEEAQKEARDTIKERYGPEFLPEQIPVYKTKSTSAQEAHEAIRPTQIGRRPELIKAFLNRDQYRLYQLIWDRFIASQMKPAVLDTVTADISAGNYLLKANGSVIRFAGFLEVYQEGKDDESPEPEEGRLPELRVGEIVSLEKLDLKQHFTQPPPRYTEATLIKMLEEKGIGRPSTYAPTIDTILKRNYVQVEQKRLNPTKLGEIVVELLKEKFSGIVDFDFTAEMEEKLDKIEEGDLDWEKVLTDFYQPFIAEVQKASENIERVEIPLEESDEKCEKCGRTMVYKYGRFGKFLACPGYPECKTTKPIRKALGVKCPKCATGEITERKSKKGRLFYGCNQYPQCSFVSWERPYKDPCPKCASMCAVKGGKADKTITCLNEACDYQEKLAERGESE